MTPLETVDLAAANIARAYQLLGAMSVTVRQSGSELRVIAPGVGVPPTAEFLHKAADMIFDGQTVTTQQAGTV